MTRTTPPSPPRPAPRARLAAALTLSLGAAVALSLGACKRGDADARAESAPKPLVVGTENVAVVRPDRIETGPAISGSLQAEQEATLRAQVAGAIVETYAEQGQRVAAGQLLAKIDDTAIRDAYLSARSAVTSAQASLDVARREAERAETLLKAGAIAEREAENARRALTTAQAAFADARARYVAQEKQLEYTKITAPFEGAVSARQVSAGDVVQPGTALYTVVDPTTMRLEASVPAEQITSVKPGQPVSFTVSGYPGRAFAGRISRVSPSADPTTGQVRIYVSIPNTGRALVAGLFAEGRVATDARDALVVPATAVNLRGLTPSVMRIKNGRAQRADVAVGVQDAATERVEIRSGLAAGDTVLLGAAQAVNPGTPVQVAVVRDKP
jgi:RND family efflux transporter MFP subunit